MPKPNFFRFSEHMHSKILPLFISALSVFLESNFLNYKQCLHSFISTFPLDKTFKVQPTGGTCLNRRTIVFDVKCQVRNTKVFATKIKFKQHTFVSLSIEKGTYSNCLPR